MLAHNGVNMLTQRLLCRCRFLSSRPTTRDPAERETECKWRDPENVRTTRLIQGVSTRTLSPKCAGKVGTQRGENASYRMAEAAPSGFLDYALSLPLRGILRPPLEMTD